MSQARSMFMCYTFKKVDGNPKYTRKIILVKLLFLATESVQNCILARLDCNQEHAKGCRCRGSPGSPLNFYPKISNFIGLNLKFFALLAIKAIFPLNIRI